MKALTVSQMASARLRANKKAYFSLIIGIFLSVFLVTMLVLCIQGVILAKIEQTHRKLGYEDAFLLDMPEITDDDLMQMGYCDEIGHVYVSASIQDTDIRLGYYNDAGAALMNRQLLEGRMPEKAGEIAMERSAMLAIREDGQWQLGDSIELELLPIGGMPETRSFTLVGILAEQSSYLAEQNMGYQNFETAFPALLVSPEEADFASGRVALHRVLTLTEPVSLELFQAFHSRNAFGHFYVISMMGELLIVYSSPKNIWASHSNAFAVAIMASLLILSLLVSCCVGIAGSMEGILCKRSEEIGILRALGATRRQIRRIFGRESWILALTAAPFSIGLSCLFVWGLALWKPEALVFRLNPLLLLPITVLSAAAILISGSIPLRRASRQMPMSVIRDTGLLRKSRRVKSRRQFHVPALISGRLIRLFPSRLLGAILLSSLMCLCAAFLSIAFDDGIQLFNPDSPAYFIVMHGNSAPLGFISLFPGQPLSNQSLRQLESLPNVRSVSVNRDLDINLLLEEKTNYFSVRSLSNVPMMSFEQYCESQSQFGHSIDREMLRDNYDLILKQYDSMRKSLGISQEMVFTDLKTFEPNERTLAELERCLGDGKIDLDAINAGKEVLVVAPDLWYVSQTRGWHTNLTHMPSGTDPAQAVLMAHNDWASSGQSLPIVQLYTDDPALLDSYTSCTRLDANVTIGAVLKDSLYFSSANFCEGDVLTTQEGLRNMGLYCNGKDSIDIYLNESIDEEAEAALTESISAIARRAEDSLVFNALESMRERNRTLLQTQLLTGCIALVFFAVAVGMNVSNVTRQIQADGKRIGMLRAVGADEKVILRCYSGQVLACLILGMLLAIAALLGLQAVGILSLKGRPSFYFSGITMILLFSALCMLLCQLMLRQRVRQVTRQSIIENIREL